VSSAPDYTDRIRLEHIQDPQSCRTHILRCLK